jgi:hypothetical protein
MCTFCVYFSSLPLAGGPKLVREQWSKCGLTDSLNFAGRSAVVALPLFVVLRLLQCFRRNMIRYVIMHSKDT